MINKTLSNLLRMVIVATLCGWLPLPVWAMNKINKTTHLEFMLSNTLNSLRNLSNKTENTVLLNYEPLSQKSLLKEHEITPTHNDIHYEINKTNRENNSNGKPQPTTPSLSHEKFINTSTLSPSSSSSSSSLASSASSYFERAEMHETLTHTKHEKLLLHRNKRYLLFPEGSSFQLVFDLIIPIVDYTNFAIMGITCAVAWELPSQPPSEIIENFRMQLKDGTLGFGRRNDSAQQPLEYINSPALQQQAMEGKETWSADAALQRQHYLPLYQQQQQSSAATSGLKNYLTTAPKPLQPPSSGNFYYNNYMLRDKFHQAAANSTTTTNLFYGQFPQQQQWHNYNFQTLYANNNNNKINKKKNNNGSNNNGNDRKGQIYRNSFAAPANRRIYYKDHHQQHRYPARKWDDQNWHQKMHQQSQQMNTHYKDYQHKGNSWWERNRNRIEKYWQQNKTKWRQPQEDVQTPTFSERMSRNRKILNKRPKHIVYPIFGKRKRRRRSSNRHNAYSLHDELSKTLQLLHAREHLQSRQKLYAKIEKLYETRGQNGTACVLRALCETQRMHLNAQYKEPPQSFVMELLRTIFALPKDIPTNTKESLLQLDERYADALLLARDATQSCTQQYYGCQYSINYDN